MSESDQSEHPQEQAVDYEQSDEVQDMLKAAPHALPLPVEALKKHRVKVLEIPKGLLLNHYIGDLDVRVSESAPKGRPMALDHYRKKAGGKDGELDWWTKAEPSLLSTPLESTNKGKNPNSRWYIRGVLHPNPMSLYLAAMATFLIIWMIPAALISVGLLILSSQQPERFEWVSPQLLWVPAGLALVGLVYLVFGLSGRCKVCNQRLFIYRSRFKNAEAHHFPGMGYVLPLCLHLMVFRWFRCTHCGTPIRLKK